MPTYAGGWARCGQKDAPTRPAIGERRAAYADSHSHNVHYGTFYQFFNDFM